MTPIEDQARRTAPLELYLLGTGTSSSLPAIGCLTDPVRGCHCCRSTLTADPEAKKNIRRNTGAVLRIPPKVGDEGARVKTLMIDCGKSFRESAIEHWPKKGWREIDAVILTHPHADAIFGLDDLRGWTLHNNIQASIDMYCNQTTYDEVARAFPYLADSKHATGGGDVPQFNWIVFDDSKPVDILGVRVVPLPVHHGQFFTTPRTPYLCMGFLFNSTLAYLSDVSFVPEQVWATLEQECTASSASISSSASAGPALNGLSQIRPFGKLQALVIDCLRIESHASHFGFPQAVATARRLGVPKTYLVGFGHFNSHAAWVNICTALESGRKSTLPSSPSEREPRPEHGWQTLGGHPDTSKEDWSVSSDYALRAVESWDGVVGQKGLWTRPGCDGMTIYFGCESGEAWDDIYGK